MKKFVCLVLILSLLTGPALAAPRDEEIFDPWTVKDLYLELDGADWTSMVKNASATPTVPLTSAVLGGRELAGPNADIRPKGNTSLSWTYRQGSERFSFNIDLDNRVGGVKKLALDNLYNDGTLLREWLSYTLLTRMDALTPRYAFVRLFVNGEFFGLYLMEEAVEDSVTERWLGQKGGVVAKPEGNGSSLVWTGRDGSYDGIFGMLRNCKNTATVREHVLTWLEELNALNTADDPNAPDYEQRLSAVLNVDECLRYFAATTWLVSLDSYQGDRAANYGLYIAPDGVASAIAWDYNESFGVFPGSLTPEFGIEAPVFGCTPEQRPLLNVLLQNDALRERYYGYLAQCSVMAADFPALIDAWAAVLGPVYAEDPTAFFTLSQTQTQQAALKTWIETRTASVAAQLETLCPSALNAQEAAS